MNPESHNTEWLTTEHGYSATTSGLSSWIYLEGNLKFLPIGLYGSQHMSTVRCLWSITSMALWLTPWVPVLHLPLTSCVTWVKSLNVSVPQRTGVKIKWVNVCHAKHWCLILQGFEESWQAQWMNSERVWVPCWAVEQSGSRHRSGHWHGGGVQSGCLCQFPFSDLLTWTLFIGTKFVLK